MLVLSTPRSTSSILVQQTHGTVSTITLLVPRLLRWARCMYGRRGLGVRPVLVGAGYAANGQRSLVLGPGSTVSSLVDARSSAGVRPISRLLRRWWVRRGRSNRLRSLLLRRHVDEDDEDLARAHAGSGSHDLDAPYLARQRCRGETDPRTPMGTGGPSPFRFGGGRRSHEERIEAVHTSSLPSFGALRRDNTPTAACLVLFCSCSKERA